VAIITDTYITYLQKGIREELSDTIFNISPEETPVFSAVSKRKVSNTLFEWQTDSLISAVTTNKVVEGDDITTFPAVTATARVGNYCQISRKLLVLSGTAEAVDKAGRKSELAYQMAMRAAELKRDIESTIFSAQAGNAGTSSVARATAALGAWVKSNVNKASGDGANPDYTAGVPLGVGGTAPGRDDGTARAFTETIAKAVISAMWTSGATLKTLYVGPFNKAVVSGFAGIATKNFDLSTPKPSAIIASADVYVSNFGTLKVVPHRYMRERDAYFLDTDFLGVGMLRPFRTVELAKTGDAEKRMLLVEWGLEVKQEAALGLAADLNAS
jgi:hypothetical protein